MQLWSAHEEFPIGAITPAGNLWTLAEHWFDGRLSPDWQPRSREQSQQVLSDAGFSGPFWSLPV